MHKCHIFGSKGVKVQWNGRLLSLKRMKYSLQREIVPLTSGSQADGCPTTQCTQRQTCTMKSGRLFSSVTVEYFPQLCLNSSCVDLVLFHGGVKRQSHGSEKECNSGCGNKAEPVQNSETFFFLFFSFFWKCQDTNPNIFQLIANSYHMYHSSALLPVQGQMGVEDLGPQFSSPCCFLQHQCSAIAKALSKKPFLCYFFAYGLRKVKFLTIQMCFRLILCEW